MNSYMKSSKKERKENVNPVEVIDRYFISRSPVVEQDIMKVLFILYCVRKKISLHFTDNVLDEDQSIGDTLYHRLRNAATGGMTGHQFVPHITEMYNCFSTSARLAVNTSYKKILLFILKRYGKMDDTVLLPHTHLLTTVSNIISDYGCRSVYLFNDNMGALSWFLDYDIKVYAHNDSEYLNIIRDVLHDAFGFQMDIADHTEISKTDALVSFSGIDFYFAQRDSYDNSYISRSNLQEATLRTVLNNDNADVIVYLVHHRIANNYEHLPFRKRICEDGILDMVITLPDNIFTDAEVATSLLVINKKKTDDKVTFISAEAAFRKLRYHTSKIDFRTAVSAEDAVVVSYEEMAQAEWAFNAHIYIQDSKCEEGQELVALKDLVGFRSGYNCQGTEEAEIISDLSCSDNIVDALCSFRFDRPKEWMGYRPVSGPAVIFYVNRDFRLKTTVYASPEARPLAYNCYCLTPYADRIMPQYLAYVLMTDKPFGKYIRHVLEYYADGDGIRPAYLLNRKIPVYTDILRQQEAIRPFIKEELSSERKNIILAFSDNRAISNDYMSVLAERNIRVLGTASNTVQLNSLLNKYASDAVASHDKADAVLFDADIKCGLREEEKPYDGLIELSYIFDRYKLPFYLISQEEISKLPVPYRCLSYFTENNIRRHFLAGLNQFRKLVSVGFSPTLKTSNSIVTYLCLLHLSINLSTSHTKFL